MNGEDALIETSGCEFTSIIFFFLIPYELLERLEDEIFNKSVQKKCNSFVNSSEIFKILFTNKTQK